jgi:hypothetical protein
MCLCYQREREREGGGGGGGGGVMYLSMGKFQINGVILAIKKRNSGHHLWVTFNRLIALLYSKNQVQVLYTSATKWQK